MKRNVALLEDDIFEGNLVLINRNHPIKVSSSKNKLTSFRVGTNIVSVHYLVREALELLLEDIESDTSIIPVSGYRSFKEQSRLFEDSLIENGKVFTESYVALPNHSEHQSSLAIDLSLNQKDIDFIRPNFPNVGISKIFKDVAALYGFIERYKDDKESLTMISAEEWHFRYVGYPHSKIMEEFNFCLEEYIDYLKQFKRNHNPFIYNNYEISYLSHSGSIMELELQEHEEYSGNNVDGFIFTRKVK